MVESSEKGSEEGVGFGDINFSGVVHVEFSPGSWEEFGHVGFHLSFRDLFGDKEDLGASFLGSISVEDVLSGSLSSGVGDWDSVVVENVVHDIILVGTVVSRRWGIGGGWWWTLDGFNGGNGDSAHDKGGEFHF